MGFFSEDSMDKEAIDTLDEWDMSMEERDDLVYAATLDNTWAISDI